MALCFCTGYLDDDTDSDEPDDSDNSVKPFKAEIECLGDENDKESSSIIKKVFHHHKDSYTVTPGKVNVLDILSVERNNQF